MSSFTAPLVGKPHDSCRRQDEANWRQFEHGHPDAARTLQSKDEDCDCDKAAERCLIWKPDTRRSNANADDGHCPNNLPARDSCSTTRPRRTQFRRNRVNAHMTTSHGHPPVIFFFCDAKAWLVADGSGKHVQRQCSCMFTSRPLTTSACNHTRYRAARAEHVPRYMWCALTPECGPP